ncbi:MAG TPA: geranylgeranylglycerol-phosphate geranylgeranyltransferase [Chitinophagaceae bacterium]|jgi:4-hydroxybenzoate polyprenyltransferase
MRLIAAFLRLVRLPNLFFIFLTQFLFYYCILMPVLRNVSVKASINQLQFFLLTLSSVLIAAAGYIINDYFDVDIDQVNKPKKNVVDLIVSRRWAILWHFMLSSAGIVLSLYVSWKTGLWYIVIANLGCVFLLFGYSISLKQKLLSGNVAISLLTAWVVLVFCLSEFRLSLGAASNFELLRAQNQIMKLGFLYAGFAFVATLIREAIKDMEDVRGDERYGCRTMPVVWGIPATKIYVAVWLTVLLAVLVIIQVYIVRFHWWWPIVYSICLIILPLIYILYRLFKASTQPDFHSLSNLNKGIMLGGILSMGFFYFYL